MSSIQRVSDSSIPSGSTGMAAVRVFVDTARMPNRRHDPSAAFPG